MEWAILLGALAIYHLLKYGIRNNNELPVSKTILFSILLLISVSVVFYGPYTIIKGATDSSLGLAIGFIVTVLFSIPAYFVALYSYKKLTVKQINNSTEQTNGE